MKNFTFFLVACIASDLFAPTTSFITPQKNHHLSQKCSSSSIGSRAIPCAASPTLSLFGKRHYVISSNNKSNNIILNAKLDKNQEEEKKDGNDKTQKEKGDVKSESKEEKKEDTKVDIASNVTAITISTKETTTESEKTLATKTKTTTSTNEVTVATLLATLKTIVRILSTMKNNTMSFLTKNTNESNDKEKTILLLVIEFILYGSIIRGPTIPLVKHLIQFVFGPMLFLVGLGVTGLAMKEWIFWNNYDGENAFLDINNSTNVQDVNIQTIKKKLNISMDNIKKYLTGSKKTTSTTTSTTDGDMDTMDTQQGYMNVITNTTVPSTATSTTIPSSIYSYIRHPLYAGTIYCFVGLSIMSKSSMRLFLTGLYYALVDKKTELWEIDASTDEGSDAGATGAESKLTAFQVYKNHVKGKFLPSWDRFLQKKDDSDLTIYG